jgi:Transglutaminase-like superfamily
MYLTPLLVLFLPPSIAEPPAYVLETAETQRIEATLNYQIRCDKLHAREWVVFSAQAPELPGQTHVMSTLRPEGAKSNERSLLHRPILAARVAAPSRRHENSISLRVTHEATLRSRKLRAIAPGEQRPVVAKLADKERRAALLDRGHYDFGKREFQNWLRWEKLQRGRGEAEIDFAHRVFQTIRANAVYHYEPALDRHASAVCKNLRSDCGGLSILFVSALRANDIPARTLFGRWAQSDRSGEKIEGTDYHQAHVKAEFYAEGVGWIPVDVSQAVGNADPGARFHYFGNDPGDFLTLHVDPDLELDTVHFGRQTVPQLQSPVYWVTGQGSADATHIEESWRVRKSRE